VSSDNGECTQCAVAPNERRSKEGSAGPQTEAGMRRSVGPMRRRLALLKESALRETGGVPASDDDVVQDLNLDEIENLLQLFSNLNIRLRRFGDSARMIICKYHGRGVNFKSLFQDLARVN
jgi:hypothetical protein